MIEKSFENAKHIYGGAFYNYSNLIGFVQREQSVHKHNSLFNGEIYFPK